LNLTFDDYNSPKSYKLLSSNFRGLRSKAESFAQLIDSEMPHFISDTETWLNAIILSSEIFPHSIKFFAVTEVMDMVV